MTDSKPPKADPASTPRIPAGGTSVRGREEVLDRGDDWEVKVTHLGDASSAGKNLEGGGYGHNRELFEVCATYIGDQLPGMAPEPRGVRRVEQWNTADYKLALATAQMAGRTLRAGGRNLFLPEIAKAVGMR